MGSGWGRGLKRAGVLDLGTRAGCGTPGGQLLTRQMFLEPRYVSKLCVLSPWGYSREPKTHKNKFLPSGSFRSARRGHV